MSESVIVIGGGGHAKVVIDCIRKAGDCAVGILDDALEMGTMVSDVPVLGKIDAFKSYREHKFIIAIGNNAFRRELSKKMDVRWYTAIHPSAILSAYASIDEGTVVSPRAVVNAGASIGRHCIINTGAIIEHDCVIGSFSHVSPAAALAGGVTVGEETQIGIGASVKNGLAICQRCTVGAGAVVVKSIDEEGVYAGVPARRIK